MNGTGAPEGFALPWNTTRTMGDVWADERREAQRIRAQRMNRVRRERSEAALADRKVYIAASGKRAFAGYDENEAVR
jgi:hypothetical protein